MKAILTPLFALVAPAVFAADAPKVLSDYLIPNTMIKGEVVKVVPPAELDKYILKVEEAARANPEWFREHAKKGKPGVPLPFDERLGLTKEEYDDYIKFWGKREFKGIEVVPIRLSASSDGRWSIIVGGRAAMLSTLKFDPKADAFKSPNGELKRIEDVAADANSTLGAWTGHEWKFEEKSSLGTLKENFAIGKTGDKKYGLLVYRLQEVSEQGSKIADDGMVVRFPLGEAGVVKPKAPVPSSKPAPKPAPKKK